MLDDDELLNILQGDINNNSSNSSLSSTSDEESSEVFNQQSLVIIKHQLTGDCERVERLYNIHNTFKNYDHNYCVLMDHFKIVDFSSLGDVVQNLLRDASEIRKRAYCPYSNFAVGAAILTEKDSKVYTGCNIENSTLSPCICAERAAIPKAVCDGYLKLKAVAVVAHQKNSFTAPCGVCRQTLSEFCGSDGDIDIYLCKPSMDKVLCTKLSALLPLSFVSYKKDSIITE